MSEDRALYNSRSVSEMAASADTGRGFVDVRAQNGRLICRIDGRRQLLEWRDGKHVELVDLRPFLDAQQHNK